MSNHFFSILLSIIFISNTSFADKVVGHPTPFKNEMLENPVKLDCGVIIWEDRNSLQDYKQLNKMCSQAYSMFFIYIKLKNLNINVKNHFNWNISFLPEGKCYRCLNDERYRFHNRFIKGDVIGYTSRNDHWAFITTVNDSEFKVTFVHELFHSMSMFYGIYDNHLGSWEEKTITDELLAQEFTELLGYGK